MLRMSDDRSIVKKPASSANVPMPTRCKRNMCHLRFLSGLRLIWSARLSLDAETTVRSDQSRTCGYAFQAGLRAAMIKILSGVPRASTKFRKTRRDGPAAAEGSVIHRHSLKYLNSPARTIGLSPRSDRCRLTCRLHEGRRLTV